MGKHSIQNKGETLFKRYDGNPILTKRNWPYKANAVINPGGIMLNNETLLLVRVEDSNRVSHLTVARSADGFTNWQIDSRPTFEADQSSREERWGLEDARIVWLEEQKQFAVTYVCISESGPVVSLAITKNFKAFARLGRLLPPEDRDACLFPRRFNGRFALVHRPIIAGEANICISFSPDLKHWGDQQPLVVKRPGFWDSHRVGLACQPIEILQGWMLFYYGVCNTHRGSIYRLGIALLDIEKPWRVLRRSNEWLLEPRELYECVGDIGGVIFPTGATIDKDANKINLYYGAAEGSVAVAVANLTDIIRYINSCPKVE